jgi:hypothetical protein
MAHIYTASPQMPGNCRVQRRKASVARSHILY